MVDTQFADPRGGGDVEITFVATGPPAVRASGSLKRNDRGGGPARTRENPKEQIIRALVCKKDRDPAKLQRGSSTKWWLDSVKLPGNEAKSRIAIAEDLMQSRMDRAAQDPNHNPAKETPKSLTLKALESLISDMTHRSVEATKSGLPKEFDFYALLRDRLERYRAEISRQPLRIRNTTFKEVWMFIELVNEARVYPTEPTKESHDMMTFLKCMVSTPDNYVAINDSELRRTLTDIYSRQVIAKMNEAGIFVSSNYKIVDLPEEKGGSSSYFG